MVCIEFKLFIDGEWRTECKVMENPAEPLAVQQLAAKYMRNGMGLFNSNNQILRPQNCFERIMADGTQTIHLLPEWHTMNDTEERPRKRKRPEAHMLV